MTHRKYDAAYLRKLNILLRRTINRSIRLLNPQSAEKIADIGCGTGQLAMQIARYGSKVTGYDIDEGFLNIARQNAPSGLSVEFVKAHAEKLPLMSDALDKIVIHRVLQHTPKKDRIIRESHRVLKQGGMLLIAEPDYRSLTFFSKYFDFERKLVDSISTRRFPYSYQIRELPTNLIVAGFANINVEIHNYAFKPFGLANEIINCDDEVLVGLNNGTFSDAEKNAWLEIKNSEDGQFNLSINMIIITAVRGCLKKHEA